MLLQSYQPFLLAWIQSLCLKLEEHWCCLLAEEQVFLATGCWLKKVTGLLSSWITPEEEKEDSAPGCNLISIPRNFHKASLSAFPIYSPPRACQHTHYPCTKKPPWKGCPKSHQQLGHTDVIWAPEPHSLMLICCLSKHQAAPEAVLSMPATPCHSSSTSPKTSQVLGPGQRSSISNAFLKRKRRRLTKFRSPYTAPRSCSRGGSAQPSAACSDPKTRWGFREPSFSFTRENKCGIFLTSG